MSLRFVFNRKSGAGKFELGKRARVFAEEIAILEADSMWDIVKGNIQQRLIRDGNREISAIAQQYKRYIIGANGGNVGVTGKLESAAGDVDGEAVKQRFSLTWKARSEEYITRKLAAKKHKRWFEYGREVTGRNGKTKISGLKGGISNPVTGEMQNAMGRTATWTRAFGPVGVRVTRTSSALQGSGYEKANMLETGAPKFSGDTQRLSIAKVTVYAFGRITPAMLPSLGGMSGTPQDGRDSGLIGLLPASLAYRLGGSRAHVPYRPTLEPFLEFFLTKSLPHAVKSRLEQGLLKKL